MSPVAASKHGALANDGRDYSRMELHPAWEKFVLFSCSRNSDRDSASFPAASRCDQSEAAGAVKAKIPRAVRVEAPQAVKASQVLRKLFLLIQYTISDSSTNYSAEEGRLGIKS